MNLEEALVGLGSAGVVDVQGFSSAAAGLDYAERVYQGSLDELHQLIRELNAGQRPETDRIVRGYPVLAIPVDRIPPSVVRRYHHEPYGWFRCGDGLYTSEVTQPRLFRQYLESGIETLLQRFSTKLLVGRSTRTSVPVDFGLNGSGLELNFDEDVVWRHFFRPKLEKTHWESYYGEGRNEFFRLMHYEALSTDLALHRFLHYTGTAPEHMQQFVLFTNFSHHLRVFQEWAEKQAADASSGCLGLKLSPGLEGTTNYYDLPAHPTIHAMWEGGRGITMINVGVGAPNIWKVVDCIAPLRPYCVVLLGICGGLRQTQSQGMFALAQDFLGDSPVAGHNESPHETVSGQLQRELRKGIAAVLEVDPDDEARLRKYIERVRVLTTSNRGWEFRPQLIDSYTRGRAGAIEMESQATVEACAFHRIPAAFCGIISDVPVNGDFRLPGSSARFFRENVAKHVLAACQTWKSVMQNPDAMLSRSLRENRFHSPLR